jgi:hypothetical protein
MNKNTTIIIRKVIINDNTSIEINKGIQQDRLLSLELFNIDNRKVVKVW